MQSAPITKADLLDPNRLRELLRPDPPKVISIPDDQIVYTKKHSILETLDLTTLPKSYTATTNKEQLLLQFVEDFRRQFSSTHRDKTPLLLYPRNEAAINKFICTFVRPTLLPFQELHNLQACSLFVADFLEYLPLDDPINFPDTIQSMTTMLKTRAGDCVDMAIFLCSLLRGAGYAAYVVTGYAPQWVTEMDLSQQRCPFLDHNPVFDGTTDEWWGVDRYSEETRKELQNKGFSQARIGAFGSLLAEPTPTLARATSAPAPLIPDATAPLRDLQSSIVADEQTATQSIVGGASQAQLGLTGALDAFPEREKAGKYQVPALPTLHSSFIERLEWERVQMAKLRARDAEAAAAAQEKKEKDLLAADRVHAWVMVTPGLNSKALKRGVKSPVFVEPSTGAIYAPEHAPYITVTAAFDESQYWACVRPHAMLAGLSLDLSDTTTWEPVLPPPPALPTSEDALEAHMPPLAVVRVTPSWVAKPVIAREEYRERFPTGRRVTFYKDCVCERFHEREAGMQGLTLQLTCFAPKADAAERTKGAPAGAGSTSSLPDLAAQEDEPIELRCFFRHRADALIRRDAFPQDERVHEYYADGREGGVREVVQVTAKQRVILFDPLSRVDRLAARMETAGVKVVEVFEGRQDRLVYRSIAADVGGHGSTKSGRSGVRVVTLALGRGNEQPIRKITEKFARNPAVPAYRDVQKRSFLLSANLIRTEYHRADRSLRNDVEVVDKDERLGVREWGGLGAGASGVASKGAGAAAADKQGRGYEVHVGDDYVAPTAGQRRDALQALLQRERAVINELREREKAMGELLQRAELEKHDTELVLHAYDIAAERVRTNTHILAKGRKEESESTNVGDDILTPYLVGIAPNKQLTKQEATQVRDRCLGALKERLVERANVMQAHLDAENMKLQHAQVQFKRNAGNGSEKDEELNQLYEQTLFKIEILKTRLKLHEEAAIAKYIALEQKLNSHPKLVALWE